MIKNIFIALMLTVFTALAADVSVSVNVDPSGKLLGSSTNLFSANIKLLQNVSSNMNKIGADDYTNNISAPSIKP